jgi:hypothetical protein
MRLARYAGAVAGVEGIVDGVISGAFNLESSDVRVVGLETAP